MENKWNIVKFQVKIFDGNLNQLKQNLKITAEIMVQQGECKRNSFQAQILQTERLRDTIQQINDVKESKIFNLNPYSLKKKELENNLYLYILKWIFPINNLITQIDYKGKQILELKSNLILKLIYRIDQNMISSQYPIQIKNQYNTSLKEYNEIFYNNYLSPDNYNAFLDQEIQRKFILKSAGRPIIPITLQMNSFFFKRGETIDIELQCQQPLQQFPNIELTLYQKFIYNQENIRLDLLSGPFHQRMNQDNNLEVKFSIAIDNIQNIVPSFFGQLISIHHFILIKIIFDKTHCCDWRQRKFQIIVPIQIITEDIIPVENNNQQRAYSVDIWPYFLQSYQDYFQKYLV